jgi:hypothetical protein
MKVMLLLVGWFILLALSWPLALWCSFSRHSCGLLRCRFDCSGWWSARRSRW